MNDYRSFLLLIFFSLTYPLCTHAQLTIDGPSKLCYSDCATYTFSGGIGGPYYWKSTGDFQGTNSGNQVEICWNTIGSNEITLVDFSADIMEQVAYLQVNIYSIPTPELIFPFYPFCTIRDTIDNSTGENEYPVLECITACSGSTATYSTFNTNPFYGEWNISGGTILSESYNEVTIRWNDSGTASILYTETNEIGCRDSIQHCVVILEPLDIDILAYNGGANSIDVCLDQEVYLQAIGTQEAVNFEWHLGNGEIEYGIGTSVAYSSSGAYNIMLIGSSECKCFDTTYYQINVDVNPGPEITCVGTTCVNEEHTYYAADLCGSYYWSISPEGSIIDGGGTTDDYVTVLWNNGPFGTVGLSTSGCSDAICALETVVQIPIIDGSAAISGPSIVCPDGYSIYSVQYYNGTEYSWILSGNGEIIDGWGTNQITIEWDDSPFAPDQATLTVSYENCYLECGGSATLDITLKPKFNLSVDPLVCQNSITYFNATEGWNGAAVSWEITSPSGVISNFNNVTFVSEAYSELGVYTVIATDDLDNYCNDEIKTFFKVVASPATPTTINGPLTICKNQLYNYSVVPPGPNISVTWNFSDNSNFKQVRGIAASMEWKSNGPYQIRVTFTRDDVYCPSTPLTVVPQLAQNAVINGPDEACTDEIATYSLGVSNGNPPIWSIIPPSAGSMISNNDNTIDIMWHTSGNHMITSDYCGATINYSVNVIGLGSTVVDYPDEVCPGQVAVISIMNPPGSTIDIKNEAGISLGNTSILTVNPGEYYVEITSSTGCLEVFPVLIDTFLPPSVRVSSPQENAYCLPHPGISIEALNTNAGYTYQWFHNNLPFGSTNSSIITTAYGGYHVIVTDSNGCTAKSNTHRLWEWCMGDPPPGTCTGGGSGNVPISEVSLNCNNLQFSVTGSGFTSTSFTWNFDDPDSAPNHTSTDLMPIHEFSSAGYFYVFVQGNVPGDDGVDIFTIPAAPRFDYESACAGSDVQFRNHSTFIPGYTIDKYIWNFDDPSSGSDNTSNLENPTHIFSNPGLYNVSLNIESSSGCLSTYFLEVIVEPGPLAQFFLPSSACGDKGILFEAFQSPDILSYEWDFDDPTTGDANTTKSPLAIHTFSSNGPFDVSLTVSDKNECRQTITKTIDVTNTLLSGDITTDKPLPICYKEEITLTAPFGGINYLWSDGSVNRSITVSAPGIYLVTITDFSGCDYIPDPINVVVDGIIDTRIRGTHLTDVFFGTSYYDSLVICEGERFTLNSTYIFNATYDWSFGATTNYINESEFYGLAAGRHEFTVTVTDPISTCPIESEPFIVIVRPEPDPIQISSTTAVLCEGNVHTLSIDNPLPGHTYYWNNGTVGNNTVVSKAGNYTATAVNQYGCSRSSNGIVVERRPNANRINLGCTQACFPDTICIPAIVGASNYQWYLDGLAISSPVGNQQDLIAEEAGEYQLVVTSWNGCADTSDILSIDAEPSDQSVSGIVFIDENGNGIWDMGEELLSGIPVLLYSGSVIEMTTLTNLAGYYIFDPVTISNPNIKIDTTGLNLGLTGGIFEEDVDFKNCVEDKLQDFPLIKSCSNIEEYGEYFVCEGETIVINNIVLQGGDTWTFDDMTTDGCDSSTLVTVIEFPSAQVDLSSDGACKNENNGVLYISIMAGTGLQFAVDNNSGFTTNLQFDNLSSGPHTLWLTDINGCQKSYPFDILETPQPEIAMITDNSCMNGSSGSISVSAITSGPYTYSIDGINFSSNTTFSDLPPGQYTIYVLDSEGCTTEFTTNIDNNPMPQFDLITNASCATGSTGSLEVLSITPGSFQYSLDGIGFFNTNIFDNFPPGTFQVYVQEAPGCIHTLSFTINPADPPVVDIEANNTCQGANNGSIQITPLTSGNYEYSLDGITYSPDTNIDNLAEGQYLIFILEDGQCESQILAEIFPDPEPNVDLVTIAACIGESNGSLNIHTADSDLEFSLDGINFSPSTSITDLPQGMFTLYVLAANDCIHPYPFEIQEIGDMEVDFVDPIIDCTVRQVELGPIVSLSTGEVNYLWSNGSTDSTITANQSGSYELNVSDKCSSETYTWDIQLEEFSEEQPIYFPNVFSPNQDGINECFLPGIAPETTILNYKLLIFDRWGNKYFETTDMNDCWDGLYNGQKVRTGVFVYLLEMDYTYCVEVEHLKKYGDVTVVH